MAMTRVVIGAGAALVLVALAGYAATGGASATALLPAALGVPLAALGVAARHERLRRHAMHAAVALAAVGVLLGVPGLLRLAALAAGGEASAARALAESATAVVCAVVVGLGVRSFVNARRRR